ncbi:hypothetical protein LGM65_27120 [Burkholderia anthina]|uniref:hypothetical protein n=1 Tax=Burkholderia anthina TaxID=179879 RepID=UPI001CF4D8CA|nr:hypothetical protein [Burkholderia anthina]MCA8094504.1 hypothetical protein [Burkholderia anthina]
MATQLKVGDTVYVPCSAFEELVEVEAALYRTQVTEVNNKSVNVNLPNGVVKKIGSGLVHRDVGILLIEIGDWDTEAATLDPLAKSVLQFCRLLVPDDQIRSVKVRSKTELAMFWKVNEAAYSHVILVGHGDKNLLGFAVDGDAKVADFASLLKKRGAKPKLFISLACKTGYKSFGGVFSNETICKDFIAPFQSVHSAIASQFCQTFLASHFIDGKSTKVAFNHAKKSVPGGVRFRLWHKGDMQTG